MFYGHIVEYEGEILDGNKATGLGGYTDLYGNKFLSHFVNNMAEGAGKSNI